MLKRTFRLFGGLALGLLFIATGFSFFAARMALYPSWYQAKLVGERLPECSSYQKRVYVHCLDPMKSLGLEFANFDAQNPLPVSGWSVPQKGELLGTAVLVHGGGADRRAMLKHVPYLNAAGFHVLLIDCYNHGLTKGDGSGIGFGGRESKSVLAAVDWAVSNVPGAANHPVAVMGTSQGAFAALMAAAKNPRIVGVVAENPYASVRSVLLDFPGYDWVPRPVRGGALLILGALLEDPLDSLDIGAFAKNLSGRRVLIIEGEDDKVTPPIHAQRVYEALPGDKKELWMVPGASHEFVWNVAKKEYEAHVLKFMGELVGVPLKQQAEPESVARPASTQGRF